MWSTKHVRHHFRTTYVSFHTTDSCDAAKRFSHSALRDRFDRPVCTIRSVETLLPAMGMQALWQLTWVLALVAALLSFRSELCRGFVLQGKTRTSARLPPLRLLHVEMPKSYWTWFYLIGAIHSNGIVLAMVCWQNTRVVQYALHVAHPTMTVHEEATGITIQPHAIAFLMLFAAHTTRRAVESVLVTEFGTAKMHASSKAKRTAFCIRIRETSGLID